MLRSHLCRGDGVVKKFRQEFVCNSSPPRPLHKGGFAIFITVASTPPRRGGEFLASERCLKYRSPSSLAAKCSSIVNFFKTAPTEDCPMRTLCAKPRVIVSGAHNRTVRR